MKDPEKFLDSYPELRELIERAVMEIADSEERLEKIPKEKGPMATYKPKGAPNIPLPGSYAETRIKLEQKLADIEKDLSLDIERYLKHAGPEVQESIGQYSKARLEFSRNKLKAEKEHSEKEQRRDSIRERLMNSLPLSKYRKEAEFKNNEKTLATKTDKPRDFSVAKELKDSLWSSKIKQEVENFSDNREDVAKGLKDREKE